MHPSCAVIVWLAAVLGLQFVGYAGVALLVAGALLLEPGATRRWLAYAVRARWLLLSLWLVLAYGKPGEAFNDLAWAPTYEGVAEANLQAVRLIAMLACLAWLFVRLGRDGMVSGLFGLLQPIRMAGGDVERLVVRLSLVLENLQAPLEKGAWKQMLASGPAVADGREVVHLSRPPWLRRDSLCVIVTGVVLMGAMLL